MATDTAVAPSHSATSEPKRNIWQVPLFLFALALFLATLKGWIGGPRDAGTEAEISFAALGLLVERVSPDREELKNLLEKVASNIDFLAKKDDAHFVLGSGYAKTAELTVSNEEARTSWMLAQQHFDLVNKENLSNSIDSARSKLAFRSGKARAAIGLPPGTDAKAFLDLMNILDNTPFGDDSGEALRLRADLAMQLSPPDLVIAKDSLTRYLTGALSTPAITRERTKIVLAELHYRFKEMDLARRWLDIPSDAPMDVVVAAKVLLGRINMAESNWGPAAKEWEALRVMPNLPPSILTQATYQLGICKINAHEPDLAVKLFEEAVKGEDSPETSGAAFRLAEQYLKSSDPAKRATCTEFLARAMKDIKSLKDLRANKNNTLLDVNDINATFEMAFSILTADGAYEAGLKAVATYAPIAEAGHDREERAIILEAWAKALQREKRDFKPKAFEAANEYLAFEPIQSAVTAKADTLRKAAVMFRLADKPEEAVKALQTATKLPKLPEELAGEVWVDLADALIPAKRLNEVWQALNEAMSSTTPTSTATRARLASHFMEERQPELRILARYLFEQIAKQNNITPEEQVYHERALVNLGREYIRGNDFATAELWLRQQLHTYPTGPEAALGRLLLGVCLLQLSSVPPPTGPSNSKASSIREEALQLFRNIVAEEDAKLKKGKLSETDAWLRLQAALRVLQAYLQMKNHYDLLHESDDLMQRHRGTIEELIILNLIFHSFKQQGDQVKMLQTRDKMKELFDSLPASAFNSSTVEYSRAYWEKTWFAPEK